ncbi:NgoMIV family type II restriction endonuclease [Emcibacter sp.]|uniref:NgoMIV family type II restriction endonuclease n=1 Tax=Emcibacter sp. TaxID=1979954 RepID=UPI003A914D03
MSEAWFTQARSEFHATLLASILTRSEGGVPSNADKGSKPSREIASSILEQLGPANTAPKLPGQTAGADFEGVCASFVRVCFDRMRHLRPGTFTVTKGGGIAMFDQYAHLDDLEAIAKANREIATAIGSDYLIKPDIVVTRAPETDATINAQGALVDHDTARLSSLRAANQSLEILHASISCKWTLRSDRAQNARSEGLNLVRNRKGRLPHVAVITGEPTPGRVASLALGTGDIDCVYHFALYELRNALVELGKEETLELLDTMVEGKRLRDISDLPLDLVT